MAQSNIHIKILIDSDAFVALVKQDDTNHKKAHSFFNKVEKKDVTLSWYNFYFQL